MEAGDHPASDVAARLPVECNVPIETLQINIEKSIARGTPLIRAIPPHDQVAIIVGGGPSTEDLIEEIRTGAVQGCHIFALNGAGVWLRGQGIVADAVILLDARPSNARFAKGLDPRTLVYIATQCDESVFEAAKDNPVVAWHVPIGQTFEDDRPTVMIGGSTSTGMRALRLVHVLGYRAVHLYGYDSSYRDGEAHAYDQYENANDRVMEAVCGGRAFISTPWMIRQADDFQRIAFGLIQEGMTIAVHGDGLLPEMAYQVGLLMQAAERA